MLNCIKSLNSNTQYGKPTKQIAHLKFDYDQLIEEITQNVHFFLQTLTCAR